MRFVISGMVLAALGLAAPALAKDAALILVASDYDELPEAPGAAEAARLAQALDEAGFAVVSSLDQEATGAWAAVESWREAGADGGRAIVLLSGHMVSTAREGWLLTTEAEAPGDLSVGAVGVPLGPVLATLAEHPGQALLLLAQPNDTVTGNGLAPGAWPDLPQGVTLLSGPPESLAPFAAGTLLTPGLPLAAALTQAPEDVAFAGFASDAVAFVPGAGGAPAVVTTEAPPDMELAFWQVVQAMASQDALRAYLSAFPDGRFADEANAALGAIATNATAALEAEEDALDLGRDLRSQVQRDLALLGYNPHGIDGIFGPGTRAALAAWQRAGGYPGTGYLNADDLRTLTAQANAREAELAAEAEARRAEQERLDRSYWKETGAEGDEAGLRLYLKRYPDGVFADIARARLDEIEEARRAEAAAQERAAWDAARAEDTRAAYIRYLDAYPRGAFAEAAKARIAELEDDSDDADAVARAKAEEASVAGNKVARLLVENRLKALGYNPGPPDGAFDRATRRALRRFQGDRQIVVTGYVSQETMVHLLAAH